MANNYAINYDDKRFTDVENAKQTALSDLEQTYTNMIDKTDKFYQDQINASQQWAEKQTQLQNEQTDFAIQKIEQQKAQAQKDYTKEQSGAYVDWRKQSNEYGAEAEKMASAGLQDTGYSESSQVSMYNTYQNRVAVAREAFILATQNFDNGIREAQLQNNTALAEIKFQAYQEQLRLSLEGFQYKNTLITEKANKKTEIDNIYYNRYQDVLAQINHENSLAEQIRQYNASLALQQAQLAEDKRQFNETMAYNKSKGGGGSGGGGSGGSGGGSGSGGSGGAGSVKIVKPAAAKKTTAKEYLNALIRSGASKDKVMNEINLARSRGAITKEEALELGNIFAPRGMQY